MKILSVVVLLLSFNFAHASPDEEKTYKPGQCIESLAAILGSDFKANSRDIVTRTEKDGSLTVLYSSGTSVRVQKNGGCYPLKNKLDSYMSAMVAAYSQANEAYQAGKKSGKQLEGRYSEALQSCDAQENSTDWYKLATELVPKLQKPAQSGGAVR